jgi:hypothetical protein
MKRRSFLTHSLPVAGALVAASAAEPDARLRCDGDGEFRILTISDLHHTPEPDEPGIALVKRLIATEKPGLVVVNGDCISGDTCSNEAELKRAIGNVAAAMEQARVPWAITFGNHDQDHFPKTKIEKSAVLSYYESYPHNLNGGRVQGLPGGGNQHLTIWNAAGTQPVFSLWLLDSGGRPQTASDEYDWIRAEQVAWYVRTSGQLEQRWGRKVPGLMFFHIPLREFGEMVAGARIIGERHEPESPSHVNSGMFAAVVERGDVLGIFCGHDHTNNYLGRWHGVDLGYDGIGGYRGYPHTPPQDASNGRLRGGRVFAIRAGEAAHYTTWMRFQDGTRNWESAAPGFVSGFLK